MIRSLFIAFRQQYPQGSVVSDLVCVHDGLYLVRAAAMVENRTLATGLAAHSVLETAEDTACARALSHIGSPEIGYALPPSLAVPPPESAQPAPQPKFPQSVAPVPVSAAIETDEVESQVSEFQLLGFHAVESTFPEPPDLEVSANGLGPTSAQFPEPPSMATVATFEAEAAPATSPLEPDLLSLEGIPTPSIDLSDIIAQTDVELQRLGWNVNQGREFLEKTYGKRSRHDLTDEELLEFLLFLETQPTPGI